MVDATASEAQKDKLAARMALLKSAHAEHTAAFDSFKLYVENSLKEVVTTLQERHDTLVKNVEDSKGKTGEITLEDRVQAVERKVAKVARGELGGTAATDKL